METKKSPQANAGKEKHQRKYMKKYRVNMPKKLGLPSGRKYYFQETKNGYSLNYANGLYIGMPKILIENSPQLYTLIEKGGDNGSR